MRANEIDTPQPKRSNVFTKEKSDWGIKNIYLRGHVIKDDCKNNMHMI